MALVKIDPEFEALIAKPSAEEYAQLRRNIQRDGCRDALKVWEPEHIIVDGHNRFHICKELDLPFGTSPIQLANREEAKLWILENQIGRRNLTDDQRAVIVGRIANRRAELSRKAAAAAAREAKANKKSVADNASTAEEKPRKARVVEVAAKEARVPERKVRAAQKLEKTEKGKGLATKVLNGEMPLAKAVQEVRKEPEIHQRKPTPRRLSDKAFNARISRVFGALSGLDSALDTTEDLEERDFNISAEEAEKYLEIATSFSKRLNVLIPKLRRLENKGNRSNPNTARTMLLDAQGHCERETRGETLDA